MLYDLKRWDKPKADPFKLESLIAWLERQPLDETYMYNFVCGCPLFQYFDAAGFDVQFVSSTTFNLRDGSWRWLPQDFNNVVAGLPRTYGAALKRAREYTAKK